MAAVSRRIFECPADAKYRGEELVDLAAAGDIGLISKGVVQYLAALPGNSLELGLFERLPGVVDALYRIQGADRSRYLSVRTALQGFTEDASSN